MTKAKGRARIERGLVKPVVEPPEVYEHPECGDCYEAINHDVQLSEDVMIHDFQRHCQGKLVHFSLQLCIMWQELRRTAARIDTSHGTVHIHKYRRGDKEISNDVISTIPLDKTSKFLDDAYQDAYTRLLEDHEVLTKGWTE